MPVAVSGPLFVTTIVQVMLVPVVVGFGAPVFVIARSITGCGGVEGGVGVFGGGVTVTCSSLHPLVTPVLFASLPGL